MQVQYSQPVTQTTVGSRLASGAVVENVEYRVVSGPRAGTVLPPSEASVTRNYVTTTATSGTYVPETTTSYVTQTATSPYTNSETKYPTDAVQPGQYQHYPTGDGFTSPYEPLPDNLNRNPYFKSWYDVPVELRTAEKPPPDYVIGQHNTDWNFQLRADRDFAHGGGRPLGVRSMRFVIFGQRQEELKDSGPAIQFADFQVYDLQLNPYPMHEFYVTCPSPGDCEEGHEPHRILDGEPSTKFMRTGFQQYPVELEIDFGEPIPVGSYSWRTANDTPSRDPMSWQVQCLVGNQWITGDEVQDASVPKARFAQVGPFGLNDLPFEPSPPPSEHYVEDRGMVPRMDSRDFAVEPRQHYAEPEPVMVDPAPPVPPPQTQYYDYDRGYEAVPYAEPEPAPYTPVPYAPQYSKTTPQAGPLVMPMPEQQVIQINPQATQILHEILGHTPVDRLAARVAELLRKGADPHSPDPKGRAPFLKACRKGNPEVLSLLIDYGADPNAKTYTGETGLHRLALSGDLRCMEVALRAGADPNQQDGQGDTPLALATSRADPACVALLLRAGGRSDMRNYRNMTGMDMLFEESRRQGFESAQARETQRLLGYGAGPQSHFYHPR
mmetsp:Transcript_4500/g.8328  ORF Transcript_4500/g.8328 Transcript_4500/m.8328 type:complete len:609 (-) Transcript_4500:98-1924(-)